MKMSINPNIEEFLKYEEDLLAAVEKQIVVESNPRARVLLDCLEFSGLSKLVFVLYAPAALAVQQCKRAFLRISGVRPCLCHRLDLY